MHFVIDVDGVMTDGTFLYSSEGKFSKRFGPDDADALRMLSQRVSPIFVTADSRGLPITERRISTDLGFRVLLMDSLQRMELVDQFKSEGPVAYMGDGFQDVFALAHADVGIVPADASPHAVEVASFQTRGRGGKRAVSDACILLNSVWSLGIKGLPVDWRLSAREL